MSKAPKPGGGSVAVRSEGEETSATAGRAQGVVKEVGGGAKEVGVAVAIKQVKEAAGGLAPPAAAKQGKGNRSRNNSFGEGKPRVIIIHIFIPSLRPEARCEFWLGKACFIR